MLDNMILFLSLFIHSACLHLLHALYFFPFLFAFQEIQEGCVALTYVVSPLAAFSAPLFQAVVAFFFFPALFA